MTFVSVFRLDLSHFAICLVVFDRAESQWCAYDNCKKRGSSCSAYQANTSDWEVETKKADWLDEYPESVQGMISSLIYYNSTFAHKEKYNLDDYKETCMECNNNISALKKSLSDEWIDINPIHKDVAYIQLTKTFLNPDSDSTDESTTKTKSKSKTKTKAKSKTQTKTKPKPKQNDLLTIDSNSNGNSDAITEYKQQRNDLLTMDSNSNGNPNADSIQFSCSPGLCSL